MDLKFLYDSYIIASLMPRNKAIHYNLAMNMHSSIKKRQFNNSNASTSCQSLIIIQEKISMANVHILFNNNERIFFLILHAIFTLNHIIFMSKHEKRTPFCFELPTYTIFLTNKKGQALKSVND